MDTINKKGASKYPLSLACVVLFYFSLVFPQSSLASIFNDNGYTPLNPAWIASGLAGIGAIALVSWKATTTNKTTSESTDLPSGESSPIILSKSNHNLLSIETDTAANTVTADVFVRNTGLYRTKFELLPLGIPGASVSGYPLSSCDDQTIPKDGECNFHIVYNPPLPTTSTIRRNPYVVEVKNQTGDNSDKMILNTVEVHKDYWYMPSVEETAAAGIDSTVTSFALLNKNGFDFLYAGTQDGGVFKTTDGINWMPANGTATKTLPTDEGDIYLAKENGILYAATKTGGHIFKTINGGILWDDISYNLGTALDPINALNKSDSALFVARTDGLYSLIGAWWHNIEISQFYSLHSVENIIYAGDGTGKVWRSTNPVPGSTWDEYPQITGATKITSLYTTGTTLLAGTFEKAVHKNTTENTSGAWTQFGDNTATLMPTAKVSALHSVGDILYAGITNDKDVDNKAGVYKIDINSPTEWVYENDFPLISQTKIQALHSVNNILYAGSVSQGVFRSEDSGSSWGAGNISLKNLPISDLRSVGTKLYAAGDNTFFESTDHGANWSLFNAGQSSSLLTYALHSIGNHIFASVNNYENPAPFAGILKSDTISPSWGYFNGGGTMTPPHLPDIGSTTKNKNSLGSTTGTSNYLYAGIYGDTVYRTSADAAYWESFKKTGSPTPLPDPNPNSKYALQSVGNTLYAAFINTSDIFRIYKIAASDTEWTNFLTNLNFSVAYVAALHHSTAGTGFLFAATDYSIAPVIITKTDIVNWALLHTGLPTNPFISCLNDITPYIFAGAKSTSAAPVYRTGFNTTVVNWWSNWDSFSDGLPSTSQFSTANMQSIGDELYAGADGGTGNSKLYKVVVE